MLCMLAGLSAVAANSELVDLVNKGDADALIHQVGHGALPDEPNSNGQIALMAAVTKNQPRCAEVLLHYRANPSTIEPSSGKSPLTAAFAQPNVAMATLLMKFGGSPDAQDKSGKSARDVMGANAELKKLVESWDEDGAEAFEDEPGMWTRHTQEGREYPYFGNTKTGESQYSVPTSCAWSQSAVDGHAIFTNHITRQSKWTRPRALGWKYLYNPETQTYYWFNYAVNKSINHTPAELPVDMVSDLIYDSGSYYHNKATNKISWADPAEETWKQMKDPKGNTFWFHPKTQESTWERPQEFAWKTAQSNEHNGQIYYVNDNTGAVQWEAPEPMAWAKEQWRAGLASLVGAGSGVDL